MLLTRWYKILKRLFGRAFFVILSILLQILWFVFLIRTVTVEGNTFFPEEAVAEEAAETEVAVIDSQDTETEDVDTAEEPVAPEKKEKKGG